MRSLVSLACLALVAVGCSPGSEAYRLNHVNFVPQTLPGGPPAQGMPPAALKVIPIDRAVWDDIPKHALGAACDLRGPAPKQTADLAVVARELAEWNTAMTSYQKAVAAKHPEKKQNPNAPVQANASVRVGDEVFVESIMLECATGKPLVVVNGTPYAGDVLYAAVGKSSGTPGTAYALLEVLDRKSGALMGVTLGRPQVVKQPGADLSNEPQARLSAANVAQYIAASPADPIVHVVPTSTPDSYALWQRFENLFVDPGSSPTSGIFLIAPDEQSFTTSRNLGVNRFVVK